MAAPAAASARRSAPPRRPEAPRLGRDEADGRIVRGERTRRALAEALISLLEDGEPRPTARQVADRAGVSLRLVFHHFEDMEAVLREAVAIQVERHWSRLRPLDATVSLDRRVDGLVRQRAALYEAIAPVRRAAALVEGRSPTVDAELDHARRLLRTELTTLFAGELPAAPPKRAELLDVLELAAGWETWDQLRRRMGRSAAATRRVMTRLVLTALDIAARPGGTP